MNVALIFAGGSGMRMNTVTCPKQFLQLFGKEIIIHTIEIFQDHHEIDAIAIVCIKAWIPYLETILQKHHITKVKWIIGGGETALQSIYNGLNVLQTHCASDSIVIIHDGVRPLITKDLISNCIQSVILYGSAITVTPATETIIYLDNDKKIDSVMDRSKCFHAKAPQCFKFDIIWKYYQKAKEEGFTNMIDSASLMKHYGYELYTVQCPYDNIKITNPSDFYILRALYEARENSQIFGL
jgi:2-C-methyl-D-erythritol 4-phosphate cytidylyltransferase